MSTPNEPYDPNAPQYPYDQPYGTPPAPQYGQPPAPQYGQPPAAPQYGQPPAAPQYGQPSAPQYGQPPAAPQYGQPQYPAAPAYGAANYSAPPDNHLVWAILSTVLCCVPLGVVSIVFSTQVNTKWSVGDFAGAQASAHKAKLWAIWSAVAALVFGVGYGVLVLIGALAESNGY